MIQPTYVIYPQAVWLKEKGFDIPQNKMYSYGTPMFGHVKEVKFYNGDLHECASTPYNWNDWSNKPTATEYYSAPEQWLVIEWASLVHNIDIEARPVRYAGDIKTSYYQPYINGCIVNMSKFATKKEALSEAINEFLKMI
jgi:hypothetical protein